MTKDQAIVRDLIVAFAGAGLIAGALILSPFWPPEASLVFDLTLGFSVFSALFAAVVLVLIYFKRMAVDRHSRAVFSTLLILLAITSFSLLRVSQDNIEFWLPYFTGTALSAATLAQLIVGFCGNFVSLIVAAVAANLLASAFPEHAA